MAGWCSGRRTKRTGRARRAHLKDVEAALTKLVGVPVGVLLIVDGSADDPEGLLGDGPPPNNPSGTVVPMRASTASSSRGATTEPSPSSDGTPDAAVPTGPEADDDIDLSQLTDVPPESVVGPVERLLQAFPGSQELDER